MRGEVQFTSARFLRLVLVVVVVVALQVAAAATSVYACMMYSTMLLLEA